MPCEHIWGVKDRVQTEEKFIWIHEFGAYTKDKTAALFSYCPCCGEALRPDIQKVEGERESVD